MIFHILLLDNISGLTTPMVSRYSPTASYSDSLRFLTSHGLIEKAGKEENDWLMERAMAHSSDLNEIRLKRIEIEKLLGPTARPPTLPRLSVCRFWCWWTSNCFCI